MQLTLGGGSLIDSWFAYRQAQECLIAFESLPLDLWRHVFDDLYPRLHESWAEFQLSITQDEQLIRWFEENVVAIESPPNTDGMKKSSHAA
jgi:hypothetical protein